MIGKCILSHWIGVVSMLFVWISIRDEHTFLSTEGIGIALILQFVFWSWVVYASWSSK